jgi:hypothetical protein
MYRRGPGTPPRRALLRGKFFGALTGLRYHQMMNKFAISLLACVPMAFGQLPIPVAGSAPTQPAGGRGGRGGPVAPAAPVKQVVAPIPSAVEITGPGEFFETFMDNYDDASKSAIPARDVYAKFGYEAREYFVSGTTGAGAAYKTRIVIRKPKDNAKFNGLILAESMHPSGNPWVFHFTQTYAMTSGVIGLEILTTAPAGLAQANEARYEDLAVPNGAANDILAQVGALIKSNHADNPLNGLAVRKMILAGSSASAAVATNYLTNAHMAMRLAGMKPIYDGSCRPARTGRFRRSMCPRSLCRRCARRMQAAALRSRTTTSFACMSSPGWLISIRA